MTATSCALFTVFGVLALIGAVGGSGMLIAQNVRRQRAIAALGLEGTAQVMRVPRRERAADPPRSASLLAQARVLIASAEGAFSHALAMPAQANDQAQGLDDVLDAVTHLREAFGLLREAAELDPIADAALAPLDPWTEPAWLDAVHLRAVHAREALRHGLKWMSTANQTFGRMRRGTDAR